MAHRIIVTPEAQDQLNGIFDYIARAASPAIARRFTDAILDHLALLADYPRSGSPRDDLRPGLRTVSHRKRVTIAFVVDDPDVVVIGFFYGGQDVAALLRDDDG